MPPSKVARISGCVLKRWNSSNGAMYGILVVEMHDEADRHQVVVEVIEERAAAGAVVERPAERVLHQAGRVLVRRDLPQLLQPDAEFLRLAIAGELERCDQRLGEDAARAFGEQRVLGAQLHAAGEDAVGSPSLPMPMSPVATPTTAPSASYSTSAAAKPG